ncbi:MAG: cysteine--tRNA ligase [Elusimicrobiales bacterium]|nr:cysteine--tRNA ligase [Elusimicrobiales bacterium]
MKIYNTLSKKAEDFIPIEKNKVSIYTCGPTVYNYAHIGNLRTYIFEDFLIRTLEFLGYEIKRVMNITDVGHLTSDSDDGDDKMELGAQREGKTAWDIAKFYTEAFFRDFKELNCQMPQFTPKATEHIPEMIEMIKKLEEKGYTYKTSDGIYFDTSKFKDYYKLMGKSHLEGLKEGARVEFSKEKRNITDFSLWKFSPKDKKRHMEWDSPWGVGFPGWHIECSAMSIKYLGQPFDIHAGGVDHIPIHHTNEIAQAEAANGKNFANYWIHGEFLVLKSSEKMSKSSGNFLTLSLLKENGFSPMHYRYFCSQAHYSKQLEFSYEAMESAKNGYNHLKNSVEEIISKTDELEPNKNLKHYEEFVKAVSEDLNIPKAVSVLWETIRDKNITEKEKLWIINEFDKVFGFKLTEKVEEEIPLEIIDLLNQRTEYKKQKNYQKADEIRDILKQKGYEVKDTPKGPKVKKI